MWSRTETCTPFPVSKGVKGFYMFNSLVELVFGCSHKRTTFPQTNHGGTYVACLDCGKEFSYNWEAMRIGKPSPGVMHPNVTSFRAPVAPVRLEERPRQVS